MGQADLAARGQGPLGLAGLLAKQPAALSGRQEPLVDLAVVEGAGGDQVVEVAGRLPQLAVALASGSGGDPGQFLGQRRPHIAVTCAVAAGWELDWLWWSLALAGLEPLPQHRGNLARRHLEGAAFDPLVGVAGGVAAGWGDHIAATASPIHMCQADRTDVAETGRVSSRQRPAAAPSSGRPATPPITALERPAPRLPTASKS